MSRSVADPDFLRPNARLIPDGVPGVSLGIIRLCKEVPITGVVGPEVDPRPVTLL
jgi:hypothetical protein